MSEYPVMIKRLKGQGIVRLAAKHNLREIAAETGAAGHIDPARIHMNLILRGPASAEKVAERAKELMADGGITRLRVGSVMALELVFTLPSNTSVNVHEYFEDATGWAEMFYQVPLISSVVHLDESAPHCHVLLLPIAEGRMIGSDLHGGRTKLVAMQAAFQEQVRARYGMARYAPAKRHSAAVRAEAMNRARNYLEAQGGLSKAAWAAILKPHARDPEPLLLALGLSMPAPATPSQSFVAMMTRPTKPEKNKPIGKAFSDHIGKGERAPPPKPLPYPCVGIGSAESVVHGKDDASEGLRGSYTQGSMVRIPSDANVEYTRERDDERKTQYWSEELGAFVA